MFFYYRRYEERRLYWAGPPRPVRGRVTAATFAEYYGYAAKQMRPSLWLPFDAVPVRAGHATLLISTHCFEVYDAHAREAMLVFTFSLLIFGHAYTSIAAILSLSLCPASLGRHYYYYFTSQCTPDAAKMLRLKMPWASRIYIWYISPLFSMIRNIWFIRMFWVLTFASNSQNARKSISLLVYQGSITYRCLANAA